MEHLLVEPSEASGRETDGLDETEYLTIVEAETTRYHPLGYMAKDWVRCRLQ